MTHEEFIKQIATSVIKYAPQFNIRVHSPIIAQAILESAWGTSAKAKKNNFFGMKYRPNRVTCHNGYFRDGGFEQNNNGSYSPISTDWYSFDTLDLGVLGYFQFTNISNYSNLKGVTDPEKYLTNLRNDGYATSQTYVKDLMKVIKDNNLTRYDAMNTTEIPIINTSIPCHKSNHGGVRNTDTIKYIVVHYTGNKNDSAQSNARYFSGANRKASAHYFVDDTSIYQSVPDNVTAWSVGGARYSNYKVTGGAKYYKICTNSNSISIELCSKNSQITEKTQQNAIQLIRMLMSKYNIPIENVIRHFDTTGKNCPGWTLNTDTAFDAFRKKIVNNASSTNVQQTTQTNTNSAKSFIIKVTANSLNIRSGPSTSYKVVGTITDKGKYTIVDVKDGWYKLKSGVGWISGKYTQKV